MPPKAHTVEDKYNDSYYYSTYNSYYIKIH